MSLEQLNDWNDANKLRSGQLISVLVKQNAVKSSNCASY